jgi:hypothetical protein
MNWRNVMNYHLYDKLQAERRQALRDEVARTRLLVRSSGRSGVGRRAVGKLGGALVAIGLKLEHFDHSRQAYAHPAVSSPVQQ